MKRVDRSPVRANSGRHRDTAVGRVERALQNLIIATPEGTFLGSEQELITRFGTGRATFRQAIRLLEHQELVEIRKGPSGGFFAARPNMGSVLRAAALYLHLQRATLLQVIEVSRALGAYIMRSAAISERTTERDALREFRDRSAGLKVTSWSTADFIRLDAQLMEAALVLSENVVSQLYFRMNYRFGFSEDLERIFDNEPERKALLFAERLRLLDAILNREPETASRLFDEQCVMLEGWTRR